VGVNSGTGTNDGIYRVRFPDHTEVCFMTPGGEVSGLAHGDRKFNFVGKCSFFSMQLTIGWPRRIWSLSSLSTPIARASSLSASSNSHVTTSKASFGKFARSLWLNSLEENGVSRMRRKDCVVLVKSAECGTKMCYTKDWRFSTWTK
jgi:hypothetical protein